MDRLYSALKIFLIFLVIFSLTFVLQLSASNFLKLAYVSPNIVIIMVACSGFLIGRKTGILMGFFAGLMMDVLSISLFGFNALIYMAVGYACGCFKRLLFMDKYWVSLLVIGASDLFSAFFSFVFLFLLRGRMNLIYYFQRIILAETVYTMIAAVALYPVYRIYMTKLYSMMLEYINSKR